MKVLVTGNLGYIGCALTPMLLEKGYDVKGIDAGYFPAVSESSQPGEQITKDIRDVSREDLQGVDAIIHLAALSNDPTSELNSQWTKEINYHSTVRLAELAKKAGVKRFLFSSSCSVYGIAEDIVNEGSECRPLSEYAKTKLLAEKGLLQLNDDKFSAIVLRNGTAYGASPRMRLDLVVNNMVAHAMAFGYIKLISDGTAWRPLVHISDISRALIMLMEAGTEEVAGQVFNVGMNGQNHKVIEIAKLTEKAVPAKIEISKDAQADKRSYRVDFTKIARLGFRPKMSVKDGAKEVHSFLKAMDFDSASFRKSIFYNIDFMKELIEKNAVDGTLRIRGVTV